MVTMSHIYARQLPVFHTSLNIGTLTQCVNLSGV